MLDSIPSFLVFKRDKYKCKLCGTRKEGIEMHHIIRFYDELKNMDFSDCLNENDILKKARKESTVLNSKNCITLCHVCHNELVTGFEVFWITLLKHLLYKSTNQDKAFIKQELSLIQTQLPLEITRSKLFNRITKKLGDSK